MLRGRLAAVLLLALVAGATARSLLQGIENSDVAKPDVSSGDLEAAFVKVADHARQHGPVEHIMELLDVLEERVHAEQERLNAEHDRIEAKCGKEIAQARDALSQDAAQAASLLEVASSPEAQEAAARVTTQSEELLELAKQCSREYATYHADTQKLERELVNLERMREVAREKFAAMRTYLQDRLAHVDDKEMTEEERTEVEARLRSLEGTPYAKLLDAVEHDARVEARRIEIAGRDPQYDVEADLQATIDDAESLFRRETVEEAKLAGAAGSADMADLQNDLRSVSDRLDALAEHVADTHAWHRERHEALNERVEALHKRLQERTQAPPAEMDKALEEALKLADEAVAQAGEAHQTAQEAMAVSNHPVVHRKPRLHAAEVAQLATGGHMPMPEPEVVVVGDVTELAAATATAATAITGPGPAKTYTSVSSGFEMHSTFSALFSTPEKASAELSSVIAAQLRYSLPQISAANVEITSYAVQGADPAADPTTPPTQVVHFRVVAPLETQAKLLGAVLRLTDPESPTLVSRLVLQDVRVEEFARLGELTAKAIEPPLHLIPAVPEAGPEPVEEPSLEDLVQQAHDNLEVAQKNSPAVDAAENQLEMAEEGKRYADEALVSTIAEGNEPSDEQKHAAELAAKTVEEAKEAVDGARHQWATQVGELREEYDELSAKAYEEAALEAHESAEEALEHSSRAAVAQGMMEQISKLNEHIRETRDESLAARKEGEAQLADALDRRVVDLEQLLSQAEDVLARIGELPLRSRAATGLAGATGVYGDDLAQEQSRIIAQALSEASARAVEAQLEAVRKHKSGSEEEVQAAEAIADHMMSEAQLLHKQEQLRLAVQKAQTDLVLAQSEGSADLIFAARQSYQSLLQQLQEVDAAVEAARVERNNIAVRAEELAAEAAKLAAEARDANVTVPQPPVEEIDLEVPTLVGDALVPENVEQAYGSAVALSDAAREAAEEKLRHEAEAAAKALEEQLLAEQIAKLEEEARILRDAQHLALQRQEQARQDSEKLRQQEEEIKRAAESAAAELAAAEQEKLRIEEERKEKDAAIELSNTRARELQGKLTEYELAVKMAEALAALEQSSTGATGATGGNGDGLAFGDVTTASAPIGVQEAAALDAAALIEVSAAGRDSPSPSPINLDALKHELGVTSLAQLVTALHARIAEVRAEVISNMETSQAAASRSVHLAAQLDEAARSIERSAARVSESKAQLEILAEGMRDKEAESKSSSVRAQELREQAERTEAAARELRAVAEKARVAAEQERARAAAAEQRLAEARNKADAAVAELKEIASALGVTVEMQPLALKIEQFMPSVLKQSSATAGAFDDLREVEDDVRRLETGAEEEASSAAHKAHHHDAEDEDDAAFLVRQRALVAALENDLLRLREQLDEAEAATQRAGVTGFSDPVPLREAEAHQFEVRKQVDDARARLAEARRILHEVAERMLRTQAKADSTQPRYIDADTGLVVSPVSLPASLAPMFPDPEVADAARCHYADQKRAFARAARRAAEQAAAIGDAEMNQHYLHLASRADDDANHSGCGEPISATGGAATGPTGAANSAAGFVSGGEADEEPAGPTGAELQAIRAEAKAEQALKAANEALEAEKVARHERQLAEQARDDMERLAKEMQEQEAKAAERRDEALRLMRQAADAAAAGDDDQRRELMTNASAIIASLEAEREKATLLSSATGTADAASLAESQAAEPASAGPLTRLLAVWEAEHADHTVAKARHAVDVADARVADVARAAAHSHEVVKQHQRNIAELSAESLSTADEEALLAEAQHALQQHSHVEAEARAALAEAAQALEQAAADASLKHSIARGMTAEIDPVPGDYDEESRKNVRLMRVAALKEATLAHAKWDEVLAARAQLERNRDAGVESGIEHSEELIRELVDEVEEYATRWYDIMRQARVEEHRAQKAVGDSAMSEATQEVVKAETDRAVAAVEDSISDAEDHLRELADQAKADNADDQQKFADDIADKLQQLDDMKHEIEDARDSIEETAEAVEEATSATGSATGGAAGHAAGGERVIVERIVEKIIERETVIVKEADAKAKDAALDENVAPEIAGAIEGAPVTVEGPDGKEVEQEIDMGPAGDRLRELAEAVAMAQQMVQLSGGSPAAVEALQQAQSKLLAAQVIVAHTLELKKVAAEEQLALDSTSRRVEIIEKQLAEAKAEQHELSEQLHGVVAAVIAAERDLDERRATEQNLQSAHRLAVEELEAAEEMAVVDSTDGAQRTNLIRKAEELQHQVEATASAVGEARTTLDRVKEHRGSVEEKLRDATERVQQLKQELADAKGEAAEAEKKFLEADQEAKAESQKALGDAFTDEDRADAADRVTDAHQAVVDALDELKTLRAAIEDAHKALAAADAFIVQTKADLDEANRSGDLDAIQRLNGQLDRAQHNRELAAKKLHDAEAALAAGKQDVADSEADLEVARHSVILPRTEEEASAATGFAAETDGSSATGSAEQRDEMGFRDGYVFGLSSDSFLPGESPEEADTDEVLAVKRAKRALRLSEERLESVRTAVARFEAEVSEYDTQVEESKQALEAAREAFRRAQTTVVATQVALEASGNEANAKVAHEIAVGKVDQTRAELDAAQQLNTDLTVRQAALRHEHRIAMVHLGLARKHQALKRAALDSAEADRALTDAAAYVDKLQRELHAATADRDASATTTSHELDAAVNDMHRVKEDAAAAAQRLRDLASEWEDAEAQGKSQVEAIVAEFHEWHRIFVHGAPAPESGPADEHSATGSAAAPEEEPAHVPVPVEEARKPIDDSDLQGVKEDKQAADAKVAAAADELARMREGQHSEVDVTVAQLRYQVANAFAEVAQGRLVKAQALYDMRLGDVEASVLLELASAAKPQLWLSLTFGCESRAQCSVRYQAAEGAEEPPVPWTHDGHAFLLDGVELDRVSALVAAFSAAARAASQTKSAEAALILQQATERFATRKAADAKGALTDKNAELAEAVSECTTLRTTLASKNDAKASADAAGDGVTAHAVEVDMQGLLTRIEKCEAAQASATQEIRVLQDQFSEANGVAQQNGDKTQEARTAVEAKEVAFVGAMVTLKTQVRNAAEEVASRTAVAEGEAPREVVEDIFRNTHVVSKGDGSPNERELSATALPAINAAMGFPAVATQLPPIFYLKGYDMSFEDADDACSRQDAHLCSLKEIESAQEGGYGNCACGWTSTARDNWGSSHAIAYPMHKDQDGCGERGVNFCRWQTEFSGAYCCRDAPRATSQGTVAGGDTIGDFGASIDEPMGKAPDAALRELREAVEEMAEAVGVTGPTGAAGATGAEGPRGATGLRGARGHAASL